MAVIVLLLYFLSLYFFVYKKWMSSKTELICICLMIFLYIAFRTQETGPDTASYCMEFMSMGKYQTISEMLVVLKTQEKGFLIFLWLLYRVAPFAQALLIVQGGLLAFSYGKLLHRFSNDYFISTLCFLTIGLTFHLTGIRQSMAMSLCMLAYITLADKHYIRTLLLVALAFTFHNSAILFVLYVLFGCIWKKKNNLLTTAILSVLVSAFINTILSYVISLNDTWDGYAELESTGNGWIFFLVLIVFEFVFWLVRNKLEDEAKFHVRISYVTVILWTGRLITRAFERPAMYFFPTFVVELPDALDKLSVNDKKILKSGFVLLMIMLCVYRIYGEPYGNVLLNW